jgi:transcription initiation factor TFIIB
VWSAVRRIGVELGIDTTPPDPVAFVARVVADLGLPGRVRRDAERVCRRWQSAGVHGGRDPMGVAGAAVWSVSEVTQTAVGDVAGVSPTTIRKTVREAPEGQTKVTDW